MLVHAEDILTNVNSQSWVSELHSKQWHQEIGNHPDIIHTCSGTAPAHRGTNMGPCFHSSASKQYAGPLDQWLCMLPVSQSNPAMQSSCLSSSQEGCWRDTQMWHRTPDPCNTADHKPRKEGMSGNGDSFTWPSLSLAQPESETLSESKKVERNPSINAMLNNELINSNPMLMSQHQMTVRALYLLI